MKILINIDFSVSVTGIEDFSWEEYYVNNNASFCYPNDYSFRLMEASIC